MDRILLTPIEAAQAIGIGRSKLYELLRRGVVPSIRLGGCRRIVSTDLSDLVATLRKVENDPFHDYDGGAR